ncbi:MAG: Metallo-beta lactamase family protein [Gammaproteobacteria bacterium]|jgi:metallo-beta-lactamase family protein|nr:Metallo-beta lactamase family protein [Gammaproteobacteria bacterium]
MQLTFLGATNTVTGSKFLLSLNNKKILIDCGLFQGLKELRLRNWVKFPVDPRGIDAVILTHAHIDHSGYLPVLMKNGFKGKIYCSSATRDLCAVLLPDSGYLQEEEANNANKYGYSKHHPAVPLYTRQDAERVLTLFHPLEFRKKEKLDEDTFFSLIPAGHILGAAFVQIKSYHETLLFSGDLGRPHDIVMPPPAVMQEADYLVLESTYGNRLHAKIDPLIELADIISRTVKRGGTIVIPAFAVGRAQHLLYLMYLLKIAKRVPAVPIYLDSPMAKNATDIFLKYTALHRLDAALSKKVCEVATYVNTKEESQRLDQDPLPKIIISASGMLEGGRVLHHIKTFGPDERSTIIFTGYQAAGTRGADMMHGKRKLKIFGTTLEIKAEVKMLSNMSAHADYEEILDWLGNFNHHPRKVFITHGEPEAALSLKEKIEQRFRWTCVIPDYMYAEML